MNPKEIGELVLLIGSKAMLRIEQWRNDGSGKPLQNKGAWRVGIEWYGEDVYEFIVEKQELVDALRVARAYINTHGTHVEKPKGK